jgi:protein SCO1/2
MSCLPEARRRELLLAALGIAGLSACGPQQARFHNTDITGASYARDFRLTDSAGQMRSLADFRGKVVSLFFGYTSCPDVCPTTLAEMREVKAALGADGERLQVVFVTVDPERDTGEVLGRYVSAFDPGFVGLGGTPADIAAMAREFRIVYEKVPGKEPGSYTLNHTAGSYVFDPQGRLRLFLRHGQGTQPIVEDIRLLLAGR